MSCSTVRYGPDVIKEVGMDLSNMQIRKVTFLLYVFKLFFLGLFLRSTGFQAEVLSFAFRIA